MSLPLSSITIAEKNKLADQDGDFLICLKITVPGLSDPIRIVRDSSNVTWDGVSWTAFYFDIDEIGDSDKGEVPQVNVNISNVSEEIGGYINDYDDYVKNNGYSPIVINIYVINTAATAASPTMAAEVEHEFELLQPKIDTKLVTFVLGASNPFNRRFPFNRILRNRCRIRVFKDSDCGYTGATITACDRTLTVCRRALNSSRYRGFPGAGGGGLKLG